MANSVNIDLNNLPHHIFADICDSLDADSLEHLFDALVRQQVQIEGVVDHLYISKNRNTIKQQHLIKEHAEIASWISQLSSLSPQSQVQMPTLVQMLDLPPDTVVTSAEEAIKLKRSLSKPSSNFREDVMRCLATAIATHLPPQALFLFFQHWRAQPNAFSDHILTILITDHNLFSIIQDRFNFGFSRVGLSASMTAIDLDIRGSHAIRQRNSGLFAELVPQCESALTIQRWMKIVNECPWNREIFLSLIASPTHQKALNIKNYRDVFCKFLTDHNLQPLKCLLEHPDTSLPDLIEQFIQSGLQEKIPLLMKECSDAHLQELTAWYEYQTLNNLGL